MERSLSDLKDILAKSLLIREAETQIASHFLIEKIFSFVHFYIGQEVCAATFGHVANSEDRFFGNHRSHGHYLAKGGDLRAMFAEMLGKPSGCSGGRGGSMHMIDKSVNFMGTSPILGSAIPIALGSAWEQKTSGANGVTLVFTGDGASEEGSFYESLNLASLWRLPVLIVVENNSWAVKSPISSRRPEGFSLSSLTEAFGIRYFAGESLNPLEFLENSRKAHAHVSSGQGPAVFEARVERFFEHSSPLQPQNSTAFTDRDPFDAIRKELITLGLSASNIQELEVKTKILVEEKLSEALAAPDFDWFVND